MTTLRPEHDGDIGAPYEPHGAYEGGAGAFEAVVSGLADPLTDPIPGGASTAQGNGAGTGGRRATGAPQPPETPLAPDAESRPMPAEAPVARPVGKHARPAAPPAPAPGSQPGADGPGAPAARHAGRGQAPVPEAPSSPDGEATAFLPRTPPAPAPEPAAAPASSARAPGAGAPATVVPGTVVRGTVAPPSAPAAATPAFSDAEQTLISGPLGSPAGGSPAGGPPAGGSPAGGSPAGAPRAQASRPPEPQEPQLSQQPQQEAGQPQSGSPLAAAAGGVDQETVALRSSDVRRAVRPEGDAAAPAGGRAERRKAAKAGARGRKRPQAAAPAQRPPGRPLTRMEARAAARALKDSPGVVVSRAVGELFISFGVLMLLFVTYQLWWTNVRADNFANDEASKIQSTWKSHKGPAAGAFEPGQGFAIIHIPKLDVVAPIAQGVSKEKVLDHGMVGHYADGALKTAMPEDKTGNFALAAHRNTHGEPFRYINQLVPGDEVVVETQDEYFTYKMTRTLPQTSPANVGVISPIPQGSGFTAPGRYITLTTCTPEFTSTYRLIVWGKMVSEQPRSQGLPAALQHH